MKPHPSQRGSGYTAPPFRLFDLLTVAHALIDLQEGNPVADILFGVVSGQARRQWWPWISQAERGGAR